MRGLIGIASMILGDQWRKYTMWVMGCAVVLMQSEMGLSTLQVYCISAITVAAILGQSLSDIGKGKALVERGMENGYHAAVPLADTVKAVPPAQPTSGGQV